MEPSQPAPPAPAVGHPLTTRVHLDYLDGIRALAALYVCLFHAMLTVIQPHYPDVLTCAFPGLSAPSVWVVGFLRAGHFAVSVFIVLSGYCLMLPVVRRPDGRLRGGVVKFLRRRARRVLPAYYAALVLSVALMVLVPGMKHPRGSVWAQALPLWDWSTILSHLLLFQNWSWDWYFKIDPVAWSMATESQIYLVFAFVLLPLTRRVGAVGTASIALWAGWEVHWYFDGLYDYIYWSYVGLFALGMLGATVGFSPAPWAKFCRERLPWGVFAAFAWALVGRICFAPGEPWMQSHIWLMDPLIGGATLLVMIFCSQALAAPTDSPPLILQMLEAKPLVRVGTFSYSLYLVHFPMLAVLSVLLQPWPNHRTVSLWVILTLGMLVCLPAAYLFYLVFERPGQRALASESNRPPEAPVRAATTAGDERGGWRGRSRLFVALAGVGAVTLASFFFGERRPADEHDPVAALGMRQHVEKAIIDANALYPSTCKVLMVPDEYGSVAVTLGLQLARAGQPFVVAGGSWRNSFGAQHDWRTMSVEKLQNGLSPWHLQPAHSPWWKTTKNARIYPLRDDAVLILTPPTLELSAADSTASIDFTHDGNAADFALGGWSNKDTWGRWTEETWAAVAFRPRVVEGTEVEVFVDAEPFILPALGVTRQRVRLYFNGGRIDPERQFTAKGTVGFTIPAATWNAAAAKPDGEASLAFEFPDAAAPATLGPGSGSDDSRKLGLFVSELRLRVAP